MAVLDLATSNYTMKFHFLHILYLLLVLFKISMLFINHLFIYIFICVFIHLFIYLFIYQEPTDIPSRKK